MVTHSGRGNGAKPKAAPCCRGRLVFGRERLGVVVGARGASDDPRPVPPARPRPFRIQVVDDETGWGVPLVELRTVNQIRFVTDSNGIVAFDEPGLFNRKVFFTVKSHGYEFEKDGFGFRGKALEISEGGSARLDDPAGQRRSAALPGHRRGDLSRQRALRR